VTTPAVTIAIPFFNEEAKLPSAIRAVFAQTVSDWELLLVDDGSTDRSRAIAESVRDPRVRVLGSGERRGLGVRLNEITAAAAAPLVARMDADDVMHPTRIERELALLERRPDASAVGTFVAYVDEHGKRGAVNETLPPVRRGDALTVGILAHATVLARKGFLERFPYDARFERAEDRELFFRAHPSCTFATVEEPLYVVLGAHDDSDVLAKYRASCRQNRALFRRFGPEVWDDRELRAVLLGSYAREAAYVVAGRLHLIRALVGRRGRRPTPHEASLIAEALRAGASTPVPGLQAP
jgi:glycosyltransferase involved in cell wall biosynthesis